MSTIEEYLKDNNMTARVLCEKIGIPAATLTIYKRGGRMLSQTARKIVEGTGGAVRWSDLRVAFVSKRREDWSVLEGQVYSYMEDNHMNIAEFCRVCEIPANTLYKYFSLERMTESLAEKIEKGTGGKITKLSLLKTNKDKDPLVKRGRPPMRKRL